MTGVYYNEFDAYAAAWLRNLMAAGQIPEGDIDDRSILDVRADDLRGYRQCHFFAGIGGWAYALRLAGWPDERAVWTGSCPCQPLSGAGQRKGHADERHLWPAFHGLIAKCRPATVFGEQVASKDGREWLAGVRADLEDSGYACGAADLCAAGAGAPHIRQRLWWVADTDGRQSGDRSLQPSRQHGQQQKDGGTGRLGDATTKRWIEECADARGCAERSRTERRAERPGRNSATGFWSVFNLIPCTDGKMRRTAPGIFPLVDGLPEAVDGLGAVSRVGALRGAGNAIVPQVAAEFVGAFMEVTA